MAQLLNERHSTKVHLKAAWRHSRLARQINGGEALAAAIEPHYQELQSKSAAVMAAKDETQSRRDLLMLKDALLDDKVRDLYEACKKYDRDHPGLSTMALLFPNGISPLVYAPVKLEPTVVEQLIVTVQSLGENHELSTLIEPMQRAIADCKAAIEELQTAIDKQKKAEAREDIARFNLSRQYEQNLHNAGLKFGKPFANRLFPLIYPGAKDTGKEEDTENEMK
jgi:hypothetical protein